MHLPQVWAARTDAQPVSVAVADFPGQRGMIVTLDDSGLLQVLYLGTDPMTTPVGLVEGKELDYEAMAREHRSLAAVIREHSGTKRAEPPDRLVIKAQVPVRFDSDSSFGRGGYGDYSDSGGNGRATSAGSGSGRRLTVKLSLQYTGGGSGGLESVELFVKAPEPVTVDAPTITVRGVGSDPGAPALAFVTFQPGSSCLPASCTATISAQYVTPSGDVRAQSIDVELPMCLFCTVVPPVKAASYKVTVAANRPPPQLTALFDDVVSQAGPGMAVALSSGSAAANVLSFQFYSGHDCTILVSKTGNKYRLQSDTLEAMWLSLHVSAGAQGASSRLGKGGVGGGLCKGGGGTVLRQGGGWAVLRKEKAGQYCVREEGGARTRAL